VRSNYNFTSVQLRENVCQNASTYRLKMHQKAFSARALPGPAGGAYSTPPDPLARFKRPTSQGRKGEWIGKGREETWLF